MKERLLSALVSMALLIGSVAVPQNVRGNLLYTEFAAKQKIIEKDTEGHLANGESASKPEVMKEETSTVDYGKEPVKQITPENGQEICGQKEEKAKQEMWGELEQPVWFSPQNERYLNRTGYFYVYVRKQGEPIELGHWYQLSMEVPSLSAQKSQAITWNMKYLGKMPVSQKDHVNEWIEDVSSFPTAEKDVFSLKIETGKSWEATRQDAYGTNPVLADPAELTEEQKAYGYPYPERYYMLCGKLLYNVMGYRMYFDKSVFDDMNGMDIEKENKEIQKKDERLQKDEKSWTGDNYFKFAIDTNNVGMTAAGASGEFHHSMYGFYLMPNHYQVEYLPNGGTGKMENQNAVFDKEFRLDKNAFKREGYTFKGWSYVPFDNLPTYKDRQAVKNLTTQYNGTVTLYAQWESEMYKVTLDSQGADLKAGTAKIYEKYGIGWYKDKGCTKALREKGKDINEAVTVPKKTGYRFLGYYDKKTGGTKMIGSNGKLTKEGRAEYKMSEDAVWYAHWTPYTLNVNYSANGGEVSGTPSLGVAEYIHHWTFETKPKDPINFGSFGLKKSGYSPNQKAEWNTKADGSGRSFNQELEYQMVQYAPNLASKDQTLTLYAQWVPKIYTIQLDNQLTNAKIDGTKKIYEKYETGWYLDKACTDGLREKGKDIDKKVILPKKTGYKFLGYYDKAVGGKQMITGEGKMTDKGISEYKCQKNSIWYAHYDYQVNCEDYADIPCDMGKTDSDMGEGLEVQILYNTNAKKVEVMLEQPETTVSLSGKPAGTKVGNFQSTVAGSSATGKNHREKKLMLPLVPKEGAAYQLELTKGQQSICSRMVYYKNGRFRTLAKLGAKGKKTVAFGTSIAGSDWGQNTKDNVYYKMYRYDSCSQLQKVKAPGTVYRYFRYIDVNMAYSGNGATKGKNMLEYDISLENLYQFRENIFEKELSMIKKTADGKEYHCKVKYGFEGWLFKQNKQKLPKEQEQVRLLYKEALEQGVLSDSTSELPTVYQPVKPIIPAGNFPEFDQRQRDLLATVVQAADAGTFQVGGRQKDLFLTTVQAADTRLHASGYINLTAKWNAYPTIVVTPGEKMEFYEGEKVTKHMLVKRLTAHDEEDSGNERHKPDYKALDSQIRIVKISYPASQNNTRKASENVYQTDVPKDFLLDTYYLKLKKDEAVDVLVTFAVTDSSGNTTEEIVPVKVKYNYPPVIKSDSEFYYMKEEANRGEITEHAILKRASAKDIEDGDITGKLELKGFDPDKMKMQTEYKAVFPVVYQVTDAYRKTSVRTVKVVIWDETAYKAKQHKTYVRFISDQYLWTLEDNSVWREPENMAYLEAILDNTVPVEEWHFTHQDVLAVQKWVTEYGDGKWKIGQSANQAFLSKFAYCKK